MTDLVTGPVFTDDYWRDPHGVLSRLRETAPVREVELPDGGTTWLVTRHADVRAAFTDPRLAKDWRATLPPEQRAGAPAIPGVAGHMMILQDPPGHDRLRRLVARTFTHRRVAGLRPRVEGIADALLDGLVTDAPVDLVTAYAVPLPMAVICELLGVPIVDREAFARWSTTLVDDGPAQAKHEAMLALEGYLRELVAARRAEPDDGLVSGLVATADGSDRLSEDEVVAMAVLLLIAGHETTSNLVTGAVARLVDDPVLRERLLASRSSDQALPAAVEELLRWHSPVANAPVYFAAEDVELSGVRIPRGATVTLSLAAANRDPARFADGERFDPDRETGGHLAFGHGIHFCLGASLARLEGEVALGALLERFPRLASAGGERVHRRSVLVAALRELPVVLEPPAAPPR